jgi:hypothetical protein
MLKIAYQPAKARETFLDVLGRRCDLEYRTKGGRHVVVYDCPDRPFPGYKSCETIEEARQFWRIKRDEYGTMGYLRKKVK